MSDEKVYNFMGIAKPALALSVIMIIVSIVSIATRGLSFGLDFTGGTLVEVEYAKAPQINDVRHQLEAHKYENFVVQKFGSDTSILVRLQQEHSESIGTEVVNALSADGAQVSLSRSEFVGSQVGEELREQGGLGLLLALGVIMLYIAFRFQFKFSVGAVLALVHDVIITVGMFSLFQWDFDLNVLAAVLAVIGYSLNDTIVVSDRVRENFRRLREETPVSIINISLTQTLSRTIVTGLTTLLVLVALFLFGGPALKGFSTALIVGIVVGTYSSIYVASNLLLIMNISKEDLMIPVKEGAELDDRP
ncbi:MULTISPECIES: protein translocase subunit SecF [unclassified Hahella]|uniref:protein translocase subunit SecF n=1 Tax=unclassified Hahella TaxID=2624107 RepID=UPI001C1EDA4D|nr:MULTISPECIES: protein translocase subunit SecF [unclassified Hahella]MBU6952556.1 protein translocase subunit SecF [Hahella sp. HN01]MDG9671978.1 protein translocase subunit SecF [Hahella sp. CR1]